MKRRILVALVAALFVAAAAYAQEEKAQKSNQTRGKQIDPAKPGPIHERMAKLAGEYTTESKFQLRPGAEARTSPGTAKLTSVLGGRFLQEESTGSLFGMPVHGFRLTGYNMLSERYEGVWAYTGHTGMMRLTGTSDDDGKTIQWAASFDGPKDTKTSFEVTSRIVDDDHFVVELRAKLPNGSGPALETSYSRKK